MLLVVAGLLMLNGTAAAPTTSLDPLPAAEPWTLDPPEGMVGGLAAGGPLEDGDLPAVEEGHLEANPGPAPPTPPTPPTPTPEREAAPSGKPVMPAWPAPQVHGVLPCLRMHSDLLSTTACPAHVRAPLTRDVLHRLAERPGTLTALAVGLGVPVSSLHYHVDKLRRAGAVESVRAGGRRTLALTALGRLGVHAAGGAAGAGPIPEG